MSPMRYLLLLAVLLTLSCGLSKSVDISAAPNVRNDAGDRAPAVVEPDFSNFSFPATREWEAFRLVNGQSPYEPPNDGSFGKMGYLFVSQVNGSLGVCDRCAAIVISVQTGGSATPHLVYLFNLDKDLPALLWMMDFGDRAEHGLRSVDIKDSRLLVETYEPELAKGDCCPKTYRRQALTFRNEQVSLETKQTGIPNPNLGAPFLDERKK